MNRKTTQRLVRTGMFLTLLTCGMMLSAQTAPEVAPGSLAPPFILPDVKGRPLRLEETRGKIVVLNFWAFWCDTWKAELPHLKTLSARQDEMGFRLLAVSVDGTRLQEFQTLTQGKLPFPVLLDAGGKVSEKYRIAHVPTVIILDPSGKIRYRKSGYPGNAVVLHEITRIASPSAYLPVREQAGTNSVVRSGKQQH